MNDVIKYRMVLTKSGYDDLDLNVSSFNIRSTETSNTGSFQIEGLEDSELFADMNDGQLKLYQDIDGIETQFLFGEITSYGIFINPTVSGINADFEFRFSQSAYSNFVIDNYLDGANTSNSYYQFSTPLIDPKFQPGVTAEYNSIRHYITDIDISYSASGFGGTILNEGEPMAQLCTDTVIDGDTKTGFMSGGYCMEIANPPATGVVKEYSKGYFILRDRDVGEGYVMSMINFIFELEEESTVTIRVDGAFSAMVLDPILGNVGFEINLVRGSFQAQQDYTGFSVINPFGHGIDKIETLSEGIYTIGLVNIQKPIDDAIEYTLTFSVA